MEQTSTTDNRDANALLRWHLDAGVDETIGDVAINRYETLASTPTGALTPVAVVRPATPQPVALAQTPSPSSTIAQACNTLPELKAAVEAYTGCALKSFATKTVFADGQHNARVMVIGEAPGEDEDRQGLPFVGVSGKMLDRMLGSVGLDRAQNAYITNIVFWRPPGNRKPTADEIVLCLPFVQRQIELLNPAAILLVGGPAASTLLNTTQGITKIRGQWNDYRCSGLANPIPAMATFHPAYLLRSPQQKRLAWRDLLMFRRRLDELSAVGS
jgi:uracil-DNA glycosylase